MNKKYVVRLTDEERAICEAAIKKETGKSEKLRRATILLKADADGPAWGDAKISAAVGCRSRTVQNVRQAFVLEGFEAALARKKRATPPTPKWLDGAAEAKLIAMRLGKPPAGFGRWTLRLLADQLVQLEVVASISPETVRQTLKKTTLANSTGDTTTPDWRDRQDGRGGSGAGRLEPSVGDPIRRAAGASPRSDVAPVPRR